MTSVNMFFPTPSLCFQLKAMSVEGTAGGTILGWTPKPSSSKEGVSKGELGRDAGAWAS